MGPKQSGPFPSYRENKRDSWVGLRHPSQPVLEGHLGLTLTPESGFHVSPSSFLSAIRVVLGLVGLREPKEKQNHRACFAKGLQFSLWAWAPDSCREGAFSLLTTR